MKRSFIVIGALLVLGLAALLAVAQAQTANPLLGTWTVNIAKSKYSPADLTPKSGTTTFASAQGGVRVTNDGVDSQGRKTHQEYTTNFDGKDVPCNCTIDGKPSPNQDAVAWKKIDDYTYELVAKLKGQALTTTRIVVARDGKTRTGTATGKNAQGQTINNTVLQEKK
jgi:hypothetical protein